MNLPWIDIAIIAFFVISILIGIYRGFVKEVLSLSSWVLAAFVAFRFGPQASTYVQPYIQQEPLALAVAYVAVFLLALIVFSVISHVISQIFASSGLSGIDRSLGSVFGAIRAALLIGVIILAARALTLDQQSWWTESGFMGYFQPVAEWIKEFLPEAIVKKIDA